MQNQFSGYRSANRNLCKPTVSLDVNNICNTEYESKSKHESKPKCESEMKHESKPKCESEMKYESKPKCESEMEYESKSKYESEMKYEGKHKCESKPKYESDMGYEDKTKYACNMGWPCNVKPMMKEKQDCLENMPIAMAYVPWQQWRDLYCAQDGYRRGTIFSELDLPFLAAEVCK